MKYSVGTNWIGYPEIRNFAGLPFDNFTIKKVTDIHKLIVWGHHKLGRRTPLYFRNSFFDFDINRCDLLHFFNGINLTSKNWVTTFETSLPRWGNISDKQKGKGLQLLARENCKKIIALSDCSKKIQLNLLERFPMLRDEIETKITVLHPPQQALIENINEKDTPSEYIVFTIVGNQIFSKGGRECLNVVSELYAKGYPIKLNIISALKPDQYASFTTENDVRLIKKKIRENSNAINYLGFLSNQEVIRVLKNTHVALLPAYADTYGYVVLEAQACGCPVVTTNIRALPEINNNAVGWIIEVPKDTNGNAILKTAKDREKLDSIIEEQLRGIIKDISDNLQHVNDKSRQALDRIKKEHSLKQKTSFIEEVYNKCL